MLPAPKRPDYEAAGIQDTHESRPAASTGGCVQQVNQLRDLPLFEPSLVRRQFPQESGLEAVCLL